MTGVADEENLVGYQTVTITYTEWGEYIYYATFAVSFGYRAKPLVNAENDLVLERLYADGKVIFDRATDTFDEKINGWYFRPGTEDQTPIIDGGLAYRGQIIVHFVKFPLKDYDNRIPAISAEFSEGEITLAEAMTTIAVRAGFAEDKVVTTRLDDRPIYGYIIGSSATLEQISAGLGTLFNFTVSESVGFINFVSPYLDGEIVVSAELTEDMLAVLQEGGGDQQIITTSRQSDDTFPYKLAATYFDMENNFEADQQSAERGLVPRTMSSDRDISLQLPLVSTGGEMRSLLHGALYRAWASKNSHSIRVPPEYLKYDVGEVFRITVYDATYTATIQKQVINGDYSSSLGLTELAADYHEPTVPTQPTVIRPPIVKFGEVTAVIMDIPDITDDTLLPGMLNLRVALGNPVSTTAWRGGQLDLAPIDNPMSWSPRLSTMIESGIGTVTSTWDAVDDVEVLDMTNDLVVALNNFAAEEFEDATEAELDDGITNLLIVGKPGRFEYIQFTTVSPGVDAEHVVLSGLRRGLYGTEVTVNSHLANDVLVRYDQTHIITYRIEDYNFGQGRDYIGRAYSIGSQPSPSNNFAIHLHGNSRKPMAPINIRSDRLDNGDVKITWDRRSRYFLSPLNGVDQPLDETEQIFEIEIWSDDWSKRHRRNLDLHNSFFLYYLEEQIIDGTNTQDDFAVMVWQMNDTHVGRGFTGADHTAPADPVLLAGTAGVVVGAFGHVKGFLEQMPMAIVGATGGLTVELALRGTAGLVVGASGQPNRSDLKGTAGSIVGASGFMAEYEIIPPSIVSTSFVSDDTAGTSITIPAPDDIAVGDNLTVWIAVRSASTPSLAGWVLEEADGNLYMLTRTADAGDAAATDFTFALSSSTAATGVMVCSENVGGILATWSDTNAPVASTNFIAEADGTANNQLMIYAVAGLADITPNQDNYLESVPEGTLAPGLALAWEMSPDGNPQTSQFTASASIIGGLSSIVLVGTAVPVGGPESPHEYWRLNITADNFAGFVQAREFSFRYQGEDVAVGGTASASSGTAANAFDGNTGTSWQTASGVEYLQYQFDTPQIVDEVAYWEASNITRTPRNWTIEYSDDGVTWTVAKTFFTIGATYNGNAWTYFRLDNYTASLKGTSGLIVGATGDIEADDFLTIDTEVVEIDGEGIEIT